MDQTMNNNIRSPDVSSGDGAAQFGDNTMKKMQWISLFLLTLSHLAPAQTEKLSRPTTPLTSREVVDAWITNTENHVVPVADVMPDDKYSFVPGSGEFKNVRTFAEQMKHLAANNYRMAAKIMGEKPTADQENEKDPIQ
jgi:hypothetical protein